MDYRVISIGTLSNHELWPSDQGPQRVAHATTSLVRSGKHVILIDPGLPPKIIAARLMERCGLEPSAVTDVFLTNFRPAHRWGLTAFDHARWMISDAEREIIGIHLIEQFKQAVEPRDREPIEQDIAILKRFQSVPDRIAPQVDLFPLPGFTPGTCGLLLNQINSTTLVAGDAIATAEHMERGQILRGAYNVDEARESLLEAIEIADAIIPGHDNIFLNPSSRLF